MNSFVQIVDVKDIQSIKAFFFFFFQLLTTNAFDIWKVNVSTVPGIQARKSKLVQNYKTEYCISA